MRNEKGVVMSPFDYTGHMVAPWAEAGYRCYCVDLQHPPGVTHFGNVTLVGADVREWLPPYTSVKILFAFPPCTHVAVSGARWFRDKGLGAFIEALELFDAAVRLAEWTGAPYMIENPVSIVSTYWRQPDHTFDPCDYGGYLTPPDDFYTKKTAFGQATALRCRNRNVCARKREVGCTGYRPAPNGPTRVLPRPEDLLAPCLKPTRTFESTNATP